MSAPYNDIETKVEAAYAAAITAGVTAGQLNGASVHTGLSAVDITSGTRVVCECASANGQKGVPGNFIAQIAIQVRTKVNPRPRTNSLTEHKARVAYVRDFLLDDDLPNTLSSAISDFTCQAVLSDVRTQSGREEIDPIHQSNSPSEHFVSILTQDILCFGSSS